MKKERYSFIDLLISGYVTKEEQAKGKAAYIEKCASEKHVKFSRSEADDVTKFMSAFGSDAYIISDDDIEFLKNGGVLCNLDEYGLLIAHRCVVDAAIASAQTEPEKDWQP